MAHVRTSPSLVLTPANISFAIATSVLVVVAHAIAYMTHEYSHSFTAWALNWMADPLALDYGKPTLYNFLFLGDVGDNVAYDPIFSSGHGLAAAVIALAGTFIGNAALYFVLYLVAGIRGVAANRFALSLVYWVSLMCAGNVWGYVPIRAITTHADIAIAAKGLHLSTWALFPFLIVPSLYIVYHFFEKMTLRCFPKIAGQSALDMVLLVALTSYWFFGFFGGDGTDGSYGLVSQLLSILSKYFLFPLSAMYLWSKYQFAEERGSSIVD